MNRGVARIGRALTPACLFALALAVRLLPWPSVIGGERVFFFGMDAWYHMRRVVIALATAGPPPTFDPYVNFPHGAKPIWPLLFDRMLAWLLRPFYASFDFAVVECVAAVVPPVLGALCVVAVHRLGRRHFEPPVAVLAGLFLSVLSGHVWYSQIGFVDHHVAVALATTLLLAAALHLVGLLCGAPDGGSRRLPSLLATGALAGGVLLLWPGALLHVGIIEAGLLVLVLGLAERAQGTRAARELVVLHATALAIVLPACLASDWPQWSRYTPVVLSRFQPWMFGALVCHSLGCAVLWSRTTLGGSHAGRVVQGVGLGVGILVASLVAFPDLLTGVEEGVRWFAKDEVFQGMVNESKPLLQVDGRFDAMHAELRLSRFFWILPLALVAMLGRALARPRNPALLLLVAWTAVLLGATLMQRRFFNSLSPAFALVSAWSCVAAFRALPWQGRSGWRRSVAAAAAAFVVIWLLAPTFAAYRQPLRNLLERARDEPLSLPEQELSRRAAAEAAVWLRDHTPETAGFLASDGAPEYGVLAPWGYGHLLKYLARRPTVVGNFGDDVGEANMRRAAAYFASDEPDALKILDSLRVRYVLVETLRRTAPGEPLGRRARGGMRARLSVDDSPGLAGHRLLYESPLRSAREARIGRSEFRIFERVRGALVTGRAPPGSPVRASLGYRSNRSRLGRYDSTAVADPRGRYRLRVPYATAGAPAGMEIDSAYRVSAGSRVAWLSVDENAVLRGETVEGPDLTEP